MAKSRQTAENAPTALCTGAPVPIDELMKQLGIGGPQGLAAFADPEWEFDVESERFLEAIFAESDQASRHPQQSARHDSTRWKC